MVENLKTYPNLQVVSRDGSITYNNAITLAHPKAIQVSDRFHILKNLTSYCKDFLIKLLKSKVIIDVESNVNESSSTQNSPIQNKKLTLEGKIMKAIQLLENGLVKSEICRQLNIDIRVLNKLLVMSDSERSCYLKNSLQISHDEKVADKNELINTVRDMHINKYSIRSISKELRVSRQTVTKYLDESASPINGNYGVKRKSILDPFLTVIDSLIEVILHQK